MADRPVVLFGFTAAERAQQTGISASTIARKANRFDTLGLPGLSERRKRRIPSVCSRRTSVVRLPIWPQNILPSASTS